MTLRGASPTAVVDPMTAVGGVFSALASLAVTVTLCAFVSPSALVIVRVVVYVPAMVKVWLVLLLLAVVPSPKPQAYETAPVEDEPSNDTVRGISPVSVVGDITATGATGGAVVTTVTDFWLVVPLVLVTVSVALNEPVVV